MPKGCSQDDKPTRSLSTGKPPIVPVANPGINRIVIKALKCHTPMSRLSKAKLHSMFPPEVTRLLNPLLWQKDSSEQASSSSRTAARKQKQATTAEHRQLTPCQVAKALLQGLYQGCYPDVQLIAYKAAKAAAASPQAWDNMSQDAREQEAAVQLFTKPPVKLGPDGNYYDVCIRLRQVRYVL